ncbi:hypothetical protein BSKO_02463 [Bryopsis sp. KO-2023]|nr:hypothetical protein BSKO_02463 [Bryopsis sp. KO-2023]
MRANRSALSLALAVLLAANSGVSGQSLIEEQRDRLLNDDDGPRQTFQQEGSQGNDVGDRGIDGRGPGDQSNGVGDGANANQNNGIDKRLNQVTGSQNNFDVLVDTLQISSNKQNDPSNEGSTTAVLQKIQGISGGRGDDDDDDDDNGDTSDVEFFRDEVGETVVLAQGWLS